MAVREELLLDISRALNQLDDLERQLDSLFQPITIPVTLTGEEALRQLRDQINAVERDNVDLDVDISDLSRAEDEMSDLRRETNRTGDEFRRLEREADDSADAMLRVGTRGVSAFTNLRGSLLAVGGAFAAFQGVQVLGRGITQAIGQASDLEESLSKASVVFGDFNDEIVQFSRSGPAALGLSTAAALESTATFGNLFVALGLTQQAASDLAPDIVQLAADLASFNNIEVAEAVEKLRSGLVGEVEPLRTLGVSINAALVEAKALELGLVDVNGVVTEAGKIQARYALILEQTATAQGDYARTSDGIANTQRSVQAAFQDVSASLGEALLPAYQSLLELAPSIVQSVETMIPAVAALAQSFTDAAPEANTFADAIQIATSIPAALGTIGGVFAGIGGAIFGSLQFLTDFEAGAARTNESLENIGRTIDNFRVTSLRQGLVNALQEGQDAAKALGDALVALTNIPLAPEDLEREAAALVAISGIDPARASDLSLALAAEAENIGLTAEELLSLRQAILGVDTAFGAILLPDRRSGPRGDEGAAARRDAIAAASLNEAAALEILGAAADEADTSIVKLLLSEEELDPVLRAAADSLSASTTRYLNQVEAIDSLDRVFQALPGTLEAAAAALRDAEGEIVDDFGTFFDNLTAELEAREAFETNLAILRAMGLDTLAGVFADAGLEASEALADAVSDPAKAREAETKLLGQYVGVGDDLVEILRQGIEDSGQIINTALVSNLITAAQFADNPEVRAALLTLAENLSSELQLTPTINIPELGEVAFGLPRINAPQQPAAPVPGQFAPQVTNNFFTQPNPTTDTTRITQAVAAVVGVPS